STIDSMVVPALHRFIENIFIYEMRPWEALERSFGEDRHALEASPVFLCFTDMRAKVTVSRMLAYSNFAESRPWGLDMYCCEHCGGPSQNIRFNACRQKSYGNKWLQMKMKYYCQQCKVSKQAIPAPDWVNSCRSDSMYRVWYDWPLTHEQLASIGVRC
ncbi:hypothetical protein EV424DRAFT_1326776, partial [Suillus variegatus]